ncbi:ABC-2 type transport system permease protein [Microbacterium terrae]|uniref:ABC-2 family transporter protein n=1 Tax=Microbacterium terrae TaxID=69369 RepID=A0A0M2H9L2_9MICO|nr:ABC transporter permease subunit [Microbacterium terrae]KJL41320.1 ABC-2 family transporter protein [Microbacterium terrae]MBP1077642.1 ABC-2 type transport system permease protein [Microbacterium terrae]GLJ99247.1 ABC transporter permease [Microbacterium terrae]
MTTLTAQPAARTRAASSYRLTFGHLLRSEAIKIATVRSTWWSLGVAALLSVGISMMIASASSSFGPGFPAVSAILSPTQFTMLVAGILGAIVITGEYSTGMIRSTLAAEPRRGRVVLAKAVVLALVMAVTTIVTYAIAIAATAPFLTEGIDWSDSAQSIVPLAYGVLSMVVFTLLGLGFGFIIRNGAGAIAATVGVLFVLPIVFSLFSMAGEAWQWIVDLGAYLPMNAASALTTPGAEEFLPSLLALAGWVVVPLVLGWGVLRTRDA